MSPFVLEQRLKKMLCLVQTSFHYRLALLRIANDINTSADSKHATVLVGLDISVAFEGIRHSVLINKMYPDIGYRFARFSLGMAAFVSI